MLCFVIGSTLLGLVCSQIIPENPCPDRFTYKQQRGVYYGEVNIPNDGSKDLNLAVNISMVGIYQDAKLKLEMLTPAAEILSSTFLRYRVNFPFQNVIPKITQITFNGMIYCYGPSEPVGMEGVTNLWANIVYKINQYTYTIASGLKDPRLDSFPTNNVTNYNPPPYKNPFLGTNTPTASEPNEVIIPRYTSPSSVSLEESCGVANDIRTLVLKGENTTENEYPWLVAMFHRQGVSYGFQCTANLISNRHVLTAAHCVWFYKAPLVDKEDILLVLGRSDISRWASTGAIIRTALEVTPHPNYQQGSGHCDVAIVKMNEEITFRPSVRPVCLWTGDSNLKRIVNTEGTVAGWGQSEARQVVATPRQVVMPIASQETCLRSHSDFKNLTSGMTFCAGKKDGSGPCSGDSGAGFMVKKGGRWYLRGLVSTAIKNEDFSCNLNEFIVFADVAKLMDWVRVVVK